MNRQDILLGACMYALIIAAGLSGPVLKKLSKLPWDRSAGKIVQDLLLPSMPALDQKAKKALLASRVHQILAPDNSAPVSDSSLEGIHQKLDENWKKMASHQVGTDSGSVSPNNPISLSGTKKGLKPVNKSPGKKDSHLETFTKS
jgi:hypothetical protein